MSTFRSTRLRLAQHRLCLERDVTAGIIPANGFAAVDSCYATLGRMLEVARVELEANGSLRRDREFAGLFVSGCARLARQMFVAMYHEPRGRVLALRAKRLQAEGRALLEHLQARRQRVA